MALLWRAANALLQVKECLVHKALSLPKHKGVISVLSNLAGLVISLHVMVPLPMESQVPLVWLQLIFHLQTCEPPVLPPLHELFQDSCSAIASRPIHMGKDINWDMLKVSLPDTLLVLEHHSCSFLFVHKTMM